MRDTEEFFAIKAIRKSLLIDSDIVEMTQMESNIMQNNNHPNLMKMEYCFQNAHILFFVMKLIQGGELRQQLREKKTFPENVVKFWAVQIIDAVMKLHERDIIHRDLKLENILVDENGYLVIIDYGVSKILDHHEQRTETMTGTMESMAPEQLSGEDYTYSIDWWAVGIMIYELLFGLNPFNLEEEDFNIEEYKEEIQNNELNFEHDGITCTQEV